MQWLADQLRDLATWLLTWLGSVLWYLIAYVWAAVLDLLQWGWELLVGGAQELLNAIQAALPTDWAVNWAPYLDFVAAANQWFPVAEGTAMCGALFMFYLGFWTIKMALKLIPTIG